MTASTECRLLIDPPGPGAWNMAVDEVLLQWSAEEGACCCRFYGWSEPTLSLGYFQPYTARGLHASSRDCPAVRRLTGGGAIVHDAELTYSVALPAGHPLAAQRDSLYEVVHASLIDVLADLGLAATLCPKSIRRPQRQEPFLCFQRRAPGDVLVDGTKVAGSAQRRRRGAVLQHGSVLLRRSPAATELAGLGDLAGRTISADELTDAWLAVLPERLGVAWHRHQLSPQQQRRAAALVEDRYASIRWTENRARQATR